MKLEGQVFTSPPPPAQDTAMCVCRLVPVMVPVLVPALLLQLPFTSSYPDRVPDSACGWMAPWHEPYTEPAQGPAPYRLNTYLSRVLAGSTVPVCLVGAQPFMGFMMQGQDAATGEVIGSWLLDTDSPATTMACANPNDTLTHNSRNYKEVESFSWFSPEDFNGTVVFKVTVVTSYTEYWTDITSRAFSLVSV